MWCITSDGVEDGESTCFDRSLFGLRMLNHTCFCRSWLCDLWMYCIQLANILLRIFASLLLRDISYNFLCVVFIWFWYQSDVGFMKLLSIPYFSVFLKSLIRIDIKSSLNIRIHMWSLWSCAFVLGEVFMFPFSLSVFMIQFWEVIMILKICLFLCFQLVVT